MSSHHFVKEGQEPALFIVDEVPFDAIASLLEWVPLVLVADTALNIVSQWDIKIDVILQGDSQSTLIEEITVRQGPVRIIQCESVLSQGIEFLINEKYDSVNLICQPTEKVLHEVTRFSDRIQLAVYSEIEKWIYVRKGRFEKWMPENASLSFVDPDYSIFKMEGLVAEKNRWKTRCAGLVVVESRSPFWIKEDHLSEH